ncbi:Chloroperoxidase [Leptodontidium sp. 2 PMI_412]|nr:Chloroperoxidase [Leptodontidium sp. 2 PMI_412]
MKYSLCLATLGLQASQVIAFPARMFDLNINEGEKRELARISLAVEASTKRDLQYVSNQGAHQIVPPGKNDLRGPCPGLNAMTNHNCIPHNGVATISQFIQGTYNVFGMGLDLDAFLAVYGAIFDGDLTPWSIGGPPPAGLLGKVGLLSPPQGISGSHNKYESDASPTRPDLYQYPTPFRAKRFQQSIEQNSFFFNGPFTGVVVQPAAYTFIYRFMSNKSAEYPDGYLNGNVLKSFFAYKRAIGDEYTIPFFNNDLTAAALQYPQFLSVGGNLGEVNSFAGVDLVNLRGGNNAMCFAYQFAQQTAPDILNGLFSSITKPLDQLNSALAPVFSQLGCPQLAKVDNSQFQKYPGAKGAY